ncbi:hypothetical protein BDZ89DRAFT_1217928 [Hymenopellis radicata]|nr:hypothetical protein BDZ89DRAFT_1217928 [Hymenopellis radicata]
MLTGIQGQGEHSNMHLQGHCEHDTVALQVQCHGDCQTRAQQDTAASSSWHSDDQCFCVYAPQQRRYEYMYQEGWGGAGDLGGLDIDYIPMSVIPDAMYACCVQIQKFKVTSWPILPRRIFLARATNTAVDEHKLDTTEMVGSEKDREYSLGGTSTRREYSVAFGVCTSTLAACRVVDLGLGFMPGLLLLSLRQQQRMHNNNDSTMDTGRWTPDAGITTMQDTANADEEIDDVFATTRRQQRQRQDDAAMVAVVGWRAEAGTVLGPPSHHHHPITPTTTTLSPYSCTAECPRAIARGCSPGMNELWASLRGLIREIRRRPGSRTSTRKPREYSTRLTRESTRVESNADHGSRLLASSTRLTDRESDPDLTR